MTKKTTKKTTAKAPSKATKTAKKEPTIYIGPTLRGGRLAKATIFKGGELSANAKALVDEHKVIGRLIVPVSKLAEFNAKLKDPTSIQSAHYKEAAQLFAKEGGK